MIGPRGDRTVSEVKRARNIVVERARDRYEIDPRDHIRIQREADSSGHDIVGYYHSHPDHPAQASRFDAERSWAGYVYVIVSVADGRAMDANAFVADRDDGPGTRTPDRRHRVAAGHRRQGARLDGARAAPAHPVRDAGGLGRQE